MAVDMLFQHFEELEAEASSTLHLLLLLWEQLRLNWLVKLVNSINSNVIDTASKGAVLALTRELAAVHARENIRFNALCPGPLRTPLLMDFLNTEEKKQRRLVHVPMGRFGITISHSLSQLTHHTNYRRSN